MLLGRTPYRSRACHRHIPLPHARRRSMRGGPIAGCVPVFRQHRSIDARSLRLRRTKTVSNRGRVVPVLSRRRKRRRFILIRRRRVEQRQRIEARTGSRSIGPRNQAFGFASMVQRTTVRRTKQQAHVQRIPVFVRGERRTRERRGCGSRRRRVCLNGRRYGRRQSNLAHSTRTRFILAAQAHAHLEGIDLQPVALLQCSRLPSAQRRAVQQHAVGAPVLDEVDAIQVTHDRMKARYAFRAKHPVAFFGAANAAISAVEQLFTATVETLRAFAFQREDQARRDTHCNPPSIPSGMLSRFRASRTNSARRASNRAGSSAAI